MIDYNPLHARRRPILWGLVSAIIGAVATLWPLRIVGLSSRRRGAALLAFGVLLVVAGWLLPAPEMRVTSPGSHLDEFMPVWQFSELHSTRVKAPPERVFWAIREVSGRVSRAGPLSRSKQAHTQHVRPCYPI